MAKNVKLLLVENVDNLGIVGDVVTVRTGYARNFLLPRGMATEPDDAILASLAAKRSQAKAQLAQERKQRESLVGRLAGLEITMARSCNDQGILYGSVSQNDLADALTSAGYIVRPRDVRLAQTIKRLGTYDVHLRLDNDLAADIRLIVAPDREIVEDEREEMEFDNEGNLIERSRRGRRGRDARDAGEAKAEPAEAGADAES